ncbi:MAG: YqzL family protein [Hydrogenibacillus sp.]|nr:YqzL family protein [Hydrogenibacillus sp.]
MRQLSWKLFEQTGSVASYLLYRRLEDERSVSLPPSIRLVLEEFATLDAADDVRGESDALGRGDEAADADETGKRRGDGTRFFS